MVATFDTPETRMNTAISPLRNQPIKPSDLMTLLAESEEFDGQLATGVLRAQRDLDWAFDFYGLPREIEKPLERFAGCLNDALNELARARECVAEMQRSIS